MQEECTPHFRLMPGKGTCFSTTSALPPDYKILESAEKLPHYIQTSGSAPVCSFLYPALPFLGSPEHWFSRTVFPVMPQLLANVSAPIHSFLFPAPITSQNEGIRYSLANSSKSWQTLFPLHASVLCTCPNKRKRSFF